MMQQVIEKAIKTIGVYAPEKEKIILPLAECVTLSDIQFFSIDKKEGSGICIDGGNVEIFKSPSVSVQVLRFGAAVWNGKKISRQQEEWIVVISKTEEGYQAETLAMGKAEYAFPQTILHFGEGEIALQDGGFRGNIGKLGNLIRKIGELNYAAVLQQQHPGIMIVLDGNLQMLSETEKLLQQLWRNGIVIGFAKTSDLFTNSGISATSAILQQAEHECWYTSPAAMLPTHPRICLHFAKLHEKARYVFRIDAIAEQEQNIQEVINILSSVSSDPVFFGYPYPLIVADQLARISNEEKEYFQMQFIAKAGKEYPKLRQAMHALDAHGILDHIR